MLKQAKKKPLQIDEDNQIFATELLQAEFFITSRNYTAKEFPGSKISISLEGPQNYCRWKSFLLVNQPSKDTDLCANQKTKKPKFLEAAKENPRSEVRLQQQAVRVDCSKSCKQIIQFHKANQQIDEDAAGALQTPKKKWVMTIREGTPIETTHKDRDSTGHRLRK